MQEIRSDEPTTRLASAASWIRGVVNLRGAIVPIADLRRLLAVGKDTVGSSTAVVVLNVCGRTVGVAVDTVCDVWAPDPGCVKPPPELGRAGDALHVVGIACVKESGRDRTVILADLEALLGQALLGAAAA